MIRQPGKYKYEQLETYKESLELKHLKRKTIIVNILLFIFAICTVFYMVEINKGLNSVLAVSLMFGTLLLMNLAFYSYDYDLYSSLKVAMYITTLGIYVISITLIFMFPTPSMFTSLFLAYAITSVYQDYKSIFISNTSLFIAGFALIVRFPDIYEVRGISDPQRIILLSFMIVFGLLLSLSSYILIKRKNFFYNQLAQIKESEIRNIILHDEVKKIRTNKDFKSEGYYEALEELSVELSKKIGIENIFMEKIELLKFLQSHSIVEALEKYPNYEENDLKELINMELNIHYKMRMIGLKASQSGGINVARKEIFSEEQFKSFKHFGDTRYIKIISFVVFYVLLKLDKPYLKALEEEKIKDIFINSEYYYRIDQDIRNIYLENNKVFDTIVKDYLEGAW